MGPLEGIKVLDLTAIVSGPLAAMMLADQGAEVTKVEPPSGDQLRYLGKPHNGVPAVFYSCNRGKKSIVIDLKTEQGKAVLKDLIRKSDVLIQNFRPGTIERMGFGEPDVRKLNKTIIYVSISGFGEDGPYAHKRVYDPVIQALSGATDIQSNRETGRPEMIRVLLADKATSLTAAQAISSALFYRERNGRGQHIRLSMLETVLAFFWPESMGGLTYAEAEVDETNAKKSMDLIFETLDGYVTVGVISDKEWVGMCAALNRDDLVDDDRFATAGARVDNADARRRMVADELSKWHSQEILERLDAHDVPSAPLLSRMELLSHEQVQVNDSINRTVHDGFGEVRQAIPAAHFDVSPSEIAGPAPQLGQHSLEILAELGYDENKRDELIRKNIVRGPRA